jgi:alpha-ketoglutarate-dependent taurine dioxygenase
MSSHGDAPADLRPVVYQQPGENRILINCSRARLTGTQTSRRSHTLPDLTEIQRCTLDLLHGVSMQEAIKVDMQPGDLLLFDNLSMLHARDSFLDDSTAGLTSKRHLLRLIVQDDARVGKIPAQLQHRWECLFQHDEEEEVFPVTVERFGVNVSH